jgi:hypothetical protein
VCALRNGENSGVVGEKFKLGERWIFRFESFWCCTKLALFDRCSSDGSEEIKELDRGSGGRSHMGLSYGMSYPEETADSEIAWRVLGGT